MNFKAWIAKFTIADKDIYYKLSLAFGLFFVVPVAGFLYFAVKYEILNDKYVLYYIAGLFFSRFPIITKTV